MSEVMSHVLLTNSVQSACRQVFGRILTVKPSMFACFLFLKFRELNKTAKLKGVNIDTVPTLIGITHVLELCGLNSQNKRRQNNFARKIANFVGSRIK